MEKKAPNQKTKKNHHSLSPTGLNQRQKKEEEAPNQQTKNPSYPELGGLKPKLIKQKKKPQIKKQKKSIIA